MVSCARELHCHACLSVRIGEPSSRCRHCDEECQRRQHAPGYRQHLSSARNRDALGLSEKIRSLRKWRRSNTNRYSKLLIAAIDANAPILERFGYPTLSALLSSDASALATATGSEYQHKPTDATTATKNTSGTRKTYENSKHTRSAFGDSRLEKPVPLHHTFAVFCEWRSHARATATGSE